MSNHTIAQSAATIFGTAALTVVAYVAYRKISEAQKPKSLYERIGGEAAVNAVVGLFYERMLADPRVARFFTDTNMVKQHAKQVSFISYALGAPKKYAGVAMDVAHRRLIVQMGMNDSHFDATKENLLLTLKDAGVPQNLIEEVASVVESTREQVMCRGKWAIPDAERVRLVASMPKHEKTLFERIGGEAAVNTVVGKFYDRMLSDPRVSRFFKGTNMAKQHAKQVSFISYALGSPSKYAGLAMDVAHRKLIVQMGMDDSHFDATVENLLITLKEAGVPEPLINEVAVVVEGTREQVMCRGKWAISTEDRIKLAEKAKKEEKSLYERIGGEAAVNAVVGLFYERMLSDPRVSRFFKDTNMSKQHAKQVSFISYALGSPKKYAGLAMDNAHRRLIKDMGMNDSHFDATKENLLTTLQEAGVPKDLRDEVDTVVESTREQVMCRGKWALPS